ncbi:MAG TPA: CocE/NonD family hydrolase [Bryobacterales bacterium]|nr:CocE/NonD family hydrolase [Bryobacterales bacterium]
MTIRSALAVLLLTISSVATLAADHHESKWKFAEEVPPRNDIAMENRVAVPMRDGVILYADIYRPVGEGKYPVLVSRTPYSTERAPSSYAAGVYFARRGYVFVYQDIRGRHESEGNWEPFRDDIDDGYDTIEWAAKQPWSTGKVGMQGGSYLGHVQWRAAMATPPHLVTIFPLVASTSLYHDWITRNGGWRLSFNFGWGAVRQESRIMQNTGQHTFDGGPENISYDKVLWHLPLNSMQELVGRNAQFYKDWLAHPNYDDYWRKINVEEVFEKIGIPVYTLGGWFDIFSQGTLRGYAGMSKKGKTETARKGSNMIIGPWGHGPSQETGALDFGATAPVDSNALQLRWYDYWLKGIQNGVDTEPPVKLFVMGPNEWLWENEYPLARTQYTELYFHSGGKANSKRGDGTLTWDKPVSNESADKYAYDPDAPVPSVGGNNCCGTPTPAGPQEQNEVESRQDVLVYTTDFIEEPVRIAGPVKVVLYASSDAVDTDFVAKLVDVYPDGKAYNMAEGIMRARYHNSLEKPELLEPGKIYKFEIDLVGTGVEFQQGHRIRVQVASSHFPQFDRNPNTGKPFGASADVKIANQTIHHTAAQPSHIVLPIIE